MGSRYRVLNTTAKGSLAVCGVQSFIWFPDRSCADSLKKGLVLIEELKPLKPTYGFFIGKNVETFDCSLTEAFNALDSSKFKDRYSKLSSLFYDEENRVYYFGKEDAWAEGAETYLLIAKIVEDGKAEVLDELTRFEIDVRRVHNDVYKKLIDDGSVMWNHRLESGDAVDLSIEEVAVALASHYNDYMPCGDGSDYEVELIGYPERVYWQNSGEFFVARNTDTVTWFSCSGGVVKARFEPGTGGNIIKDYLANKSNGFKSYSAKELNDWAREHKVCLNMAAYQHRKMRTDAKYPLGSIRLEECADGTVRLSIQGYNIEIVCFGGEHFCAESLLSEDAQKAVNQYSFENAIAYIKNVAKKCGRGSIGSITALSGYLHSVESAIYGGLCME